MAKWAAAQPNEGVGGAGAGEWVAINATEAPAAGRSGWKKAAVVLVSLAFTVGLFWFLIYENEGFSAERLAETLLAMHPGWLLAGVAAGILSYSLRALRWREFLGEYGRGADFLGVLGNTFIGFAAVMVLGRPAELLRPYLIARQVRSPFSTQAGAWLLERIYDLLAVLALTAWTLLTLRPEELPADSAITVALRAGGSIVLVGSVLAVAVLGAFTFASDTAARRIREALGFLPEARRDKVFAMLDPFVEAISISRKPERLRRIVLYTVLHWVAVCAGVWLIFQSAPESAGISVAQSVQFLALLAVASAIPLPSMAGGYFFVSALLLTEWLRLSLEAATGVTTALWVAELGLCVPLGMAAALRSGLNWRKIKNMEREAHL